MSKQIKASLDEIVEAVFKELPMGSSPYLVSEVDIALRTALERFVVEEVEDYPAEIKEFADVGLGKGDCCEGTNKGGISFVSFAPRFTCPTCHQPTPINPNSDAQGINIALDQINNTTTAKKGGEDEGR